MSQPDTALLELLRAEGAVRAREIEALGVSRARIARLLGQGVIRRVGRGLYARADRDLPANYALARVAKRAPRGVICLLSALQFHGLTSQIPRDIWLAIGEKDWRPSFDEVRVRTVRFSQIALREGVDVHHVDGVYVRIFSPAKTVADCFKYRNKLGLDLAIEALRDCLQQRKCTVDDLWRYANIDRVAAVMRPYIEALS